MTTSEDDAGHRPHHLGTRARRGADLARLSATTGAGFLSSRVRGLGRGAEAEQEFHAVTAQRMLEMLGSMKGVAMKVGQIASFVDLDVPDDIAEPYREALGRLRDAAPAADPEAIAEVVAAEYGARPEEAFAAWEPEPIAAASIGQVHRARLPDGSDVAVKVQYPGVAEAIEADLANAEAFAPMARMVSPNLQVRPLMEELRDRLADEIDYQREAQYQAAFAERYQGHPFIRVPAAHLEWCRPRIIVSELVEGLDFDEMLATADEAERRRYGEIVFRFVWGSLHRFRMFNGDPHPGNYLFCDDGSVCFLDFGSVKAFSRASRTAMQRSVRAVMDGDDDEVHAALADAGFVTDDARIDRAQLAAWFRVFHEPLLADREWEYTPEFAREVIRTTTDPRAGYLELLRRLNLPPDYLLLNRIQWGINSILGRLRARANWRQVTRELWGERPPATELGRLEEPWLAASPHRE